MLDSPGGGGYLPTAWIKSNLFTPAASTCTAQRIITKETVFVEISYDTYRPTVLGNVVLCHHLDHNVSIFQFWFSYIRFQVQGTICYVVADAIHLKCKEKERRNCANTATEHFKWYRVVL